MEPKTIKIDEVEYVRKDSFRPVELSKVVLIRTYSAGVHFGEIKNSLNGQEITLMNARRLWQWAGACSLSQVAVDGVDLENSGISVPVPFITLTNVIEVIPMSIKAAKQMMEAESWKK